MLYYLQKMNKRIECLLLFRFGHYGLITNTFLTDILQTLSKKKSFFYWTLCLNSTVIWHPVIRSNFSIKDLENKKDYCS